MNTDLRMSNYAVVAKEGYTLVQKGSEGDGETRSHVNVPEWVEQTPQAADCKGLIVSQQRERGFVPPLTSITELVIEG